MKRFLSLLLVLFFLAPFLAPGASAYTFGNSQPDRAAFERALSVFHTCAFSAEYGNTGRNYLIRWDQPIRVCASGSPTRQDLENLDAFLRALQANVPHLPDISRVGSESDAGIVIHFCPLHQMASLVPDYDSGNWGFFYYEYAAYRIHTAVIGIATDVTTQRDRNHLVQEELVGALGLTNDHWDDKTSILYQGWTTTQSPSPLDWQMLNFLYSPLTHPGDQWETVERALRNAGS